MLATAALTALAVPFMPSVAKADHVQTSVDLDNGNCVIGGRTSCINTDLITKDFRVKRDSAGQVKSFSCTFTDVPRTGPDSYYFPDPSQPGTAYPQRAFRSEGRYCWHPDNDDFASPNLPGGVGTFIVTPSGNGHLICRF